MDYIKPLKLTSMVELAYMLIDQSQNLFFSIELKQKVVIEMAKIQRSFTIFMSLFYCDFLKYCLRNATISEILQLVIRFEWFYKSLTANNFSPPKCFYQFSSLIPPIHKFSPLKPSLEANLSFVKSTHTQSHLFSLILLRFVKSLMQF